MKFHVVKLGSRPLLAVPEGGAGLWQAAIDCYPAHTSKKRLVRKVLHGLARLGLIRWIFTARKLSLPGVGDVDFEAWLSLQCAKLSEVELQAVLVWPADPLRGRVYIYLLNKKGEKVGFCKLGLDAKNNALIERERRALEYLKSMELTLSRIPKLLAHGYLDEKMNGGAYLVVETTPTSTRNIDWQSDASIEANIAEYAGSSRRIERAEVESLAWWQKLQKALAEKGAFMQEVNSAVDDGIDVCLAHGDLNCTNVLRNGNEVWLLDWEQSDKNAPFMTDQVCVVVDKLWLADSQDASGNLKKFREHFSYENDPKKCAQIIMALAYLSSVGFTPATTIIDSWYPHS